MSLLTGLVGFWGLNGNSLDQHGANNGTNNNIAYSAAQIGLGAFSSGASSYIDLGVANPSLNITGDMTIAAWVYLIGGSNAFIVTRCIANGGISSAYEFRIQSTSVQFLIYSSQPIASGGAITPNVWTHVVGTRIGTVLTVYQDGGRVGTATLTGAPTSLPTSNTYIGTRADGNSFLGPASGVTGLNQIGIWNRGLSYEEVRDLWSVQSPGYPLTPVASNIFFTQNGFDAAHCWFEPPFDDVFVGIVPSQPSGWCDEIEFPSRGSVSEAIFAAIGGAAFTPSAGTIATLSDFVPTVGDPIARRGTVQFKAQTSIGGQAIIWSSFTDGNGKSSKELVFDGTGFTDRYIASTVTPQAQPDTYTFILRRTNGWYAPPSITARGSGV